MLNDIQTMLKDMLEEKDIPIQKNVNSKELLMNLPILLIYIKYLQQQGKINPYQFYTIKEIYDYFDLKDTLEYRIIEKLDSRKVLNFLDSLNLEKSISELKKEIKNNQASKIQPSTLMICPYLLVSKYPINTKVDIALTRNKNRVKLYQILDELFQIKRNYFLQNPNELSQLFDNYQTIIIEESLSFYNSELNSSWPTVVRLANFLEKYLSKKEQKIIMICPKYQNHKFEIPKLIPFLKVAKMKKRYLILEFGVKQDDKIKLINQKETLIITEEELKNNYYSLSHKIYKTKNKERYNHIFELLDTSHFLSRNIHACSEEIEEQIKRLLD